VGRGEREKKKEKEKTRERARARQRTRATESEREMERTKKRARERESERVRARRESEGGRSGGKEWGGSGGDDRSCNTLSGDASDENDDAFMADCVCVCVCACVCVYACVSELRRAESGALPLMTLPASIKQALAGECV